MCRMTSNSLNSEVRDEIRKEVRAECSNGIKQFLEVTRTNLDEHQEKLTRKMDEQLRATWDRQEEMERVANEACQVVHAEIMNLKTTMDAQRAQIDAQWRAEVNERMEPLKEQIEAKFKADV